MIADNRDRGQSRSRTIAIAGIPAVSIGAGAPGVIRSTGSNRLGLRSSNRVSMQCPRTVHALSMYCPWVIHGHSSERDNLSIAFALRVGGHAGQAARAGCPSVVGVGQTNFGGVFFFPARLVSDSFREIRGRSYPGRRLSMLTDATHSERRFG